MHTEQETAARAAAALIARLDALDARDDLSQAARDAAVREIQASALIAGLL